MSYSKLDAAIQAAVTAHRGQIREGENALPYVTHPIEVFTLARHVGGIIDEDMLVAAALHDAVEEGGSSFASIEAEFGSRARGYVEELTRKEPTPSETQGMTKDEIWELRAGMLLAEIKRMSPEAQALKLADRLANVRDAKRTKKDKKLARYFRQTKRILEIVPESVNRPLWRAIQSELP